MRFQTANCPECGKAAASLIETVELRSYLHHTDGQFFFAGTLSDVDWETQSPLLDGEGNEAQVYLGCGHCGSGWWSRVTELDVGNLDDVADVTAVPQTDG